MGACRMQRKFLSKNVMSRPFACYFSEFEDNASLDGSLENMERGSVASFGSGNTTDSEQKVQSMHKQYIYGLLAAELAAQILVT